MFDQPGFFYWNSRLSASVVSRDVPKYFVNFVTENFNVPVSCLFSIGKPLLAPTFKQVIRQQGVVSCDKTYASFRANLFKPSCWNAHGRMLQSWTTWDKVSHTGAKSHVESALTAWREQGFGISLGDCLRKPIIIFPSTRNPGSRGVVYFLDELKWIWHFNLHAFFFTYIPGSTNKRTQLSVCVCLSHWFLFK